MEFLHRCTASDNAFLVIRVKLAVVQLRRLGLSMAADNARLYLQE